MSSQEAQPPSDLTDSLLHLCRMATALEKCTADVAVAKAVERKFSTVDNLQQFCVLRTPGIQGAVTATVSHHRFAGLFSTAKQRDSTADGSQGLEIALVGSA